jgi:hypothetical protein
MEALVTRLEFFRLCMQRLYCSAGSIDRIARVAGWMLGRTHWFLHVMSSQLIAAMADRQHELKVFYEEQLELCLNEIVQSQRYTALLFQLIGSTVRRHS